MSERAPRLLGQRHRPRNAAPGARCVQLPIYLVEAFPRVLGPTGPADRMQPQSTRGRSTKDLDLRVALVLKCKLSFIFFGDMKAKLST